MAKTGDLSVRFKEMKKDITQTRRNMLPAKFSDTGLYSARVHLRTAAFKVLVHAEFESYLEDVVVEHANAKVSNWKKFEKVSLTLAALIAFDDTKLQAPPSILSPPQGRAATFERRLNDAQSRFNSYVRSRNHGISENNVLSMVSPIGVNPDDLDTDWLRRLDGWGVERGDYAHKSYGRIKKLLDPALEYSTVLDLLEGFKHVDRLISEIK